MQTEKVIKLLNEKPSAKLPKEVAITKSIKGNI